MQLSDQNELILSTKSYFSMVSVKLPIARKYFAMTHVVTHTNNEAPGGVKSSTTTNTPICFKIVLRARNSPKIRNCKKIGSFVLEIDQI